MNALPSAFLPLSTNPHLGLNSSAAETVPGPSGATAQTGGFAQADTDASGPAAASSSLSASPPKAGTFSSLTNQLNSFGFNAGPDPASAGNAVPSGFVPPSEALGSGFGGGLASSPNVPRPGSSIDPNTGKPHTAGLTRAELEAKRAAAEQGPHDSAPSSALNDMSGREQAARQLTAGLDTAPMTPGLITPGKEMPGGWGPMKQVPVPGSSPNAPSSVYQDITQGLEKVGKGAFGLIPQGIKDALNTEAPVDKGKQPMGSPPKARRSSVGVFLENAKHQAEQVIHGVQDALKDDGRRPSSTTGPVGAQGAAADGGVFQQVKQFLAEAGQAAGNPSRVTSVVGSGHVGPAAPRTSLPSDEVAGALPGEHSTGVGALPGPASEAGVAVLPAEKNASTSGARTENQGLMPGEVPAAIAGTSTPGSAASADKALVVKPDESVVGPIDSARAPAVDDSKTSGKVLDNVGPAAGLGAALGLAAPLPATYLGDGAAHGATDLQAAGLPKSASIGSNTSAAPSTTASTIDSTAGSASVPATRHANERTDSNASVIAIRGGHEGHKPSPLAASTIAEKPSTAEVNGVSSAKSLTPGDEVNGVGHPSTRGEDTTREVGTYPKPDHDGPVSGDRADKDGHGATAAVATGAGVAGATGAAAALAHKDKDTASEEQTRSNHAGAAPSATGPASGAVPTTSSTSKDDVPKADTTGLENLQPAPGHSKADVVAGTKALNATKIDTSDSPKTGGATGSAHAVPHADTTGLENLQPAQGESKADVVAGTKALEANHIKTPASPTSGTTSSAPVAPSAATASPTTATTSPASPVTKTSAGAALGGTEKGHQRTGSNASTGSNGKKKVGFMNKLKGEIKVIGGKISHDEKKVQEGERLKHGE